jgi:hypothetical protein
MTVGEIPMTKPTQRFRMDSDRLTGASRFILLAAAAGAAGWMLSSPELRPSAGTAPDSGTVRAMIEQADAEARASRLEALAKDLTPLEKEWGIKLFGIRRTAAGYALDLRYKVLDPERAASILHRGLNPNPHVIVERSGAKLGVPFTEKAGSLRSSVSSASQIRKGRDYGALFANPGRHVKPGDTVTLVMGPFRAEHLTVQ